MKSRFSTITTTTFESRYHKLRKIYPRIDEDFEEFLNEVELGGDIGEDIPNIVKDGNKVFKKRLENSSAKKGLSGGFRVIKYLVTAKNTVYLLDIYSKSYQEDISKKKVLTLIKNSIPKATSKMCD